MAESEDKAEENQIIDSDDEEEEPRDSDSDCETASSFNIDGEKVEKAEMERLIKSRKHADKKVLNELVIKIIEDDNFRAFEYLIEHRYKAGVLNDKGQTALHLLFYDECSRIKSRQGSRDLFDLFDDLSRSGDTISCLLNDWLIKNSMNLTPVDCNGLTYLHIACFLYDPNQSSHTRTNLITKCLKNKADVNAQFRDPEGTFANFTPLHFAAINSCERSAGFISILLTPELKIDAQDSFGRTALHLACQFYEDLDDYFIQHRSVSVTEKPCTLAPRILNDIDLFAFTKNVYNIFELLRFGFNINLQDKKGNTPLLSIFPSNYAQFAKFKADWHEYGVPIIEITMKFTQLCRSGADLTLSNNNGDTILHLITRNLKAYRNSSKYTIVLFDDAYHLEMIKRIFELKQNVDVNARNKKGITPIQWAVEAMSLDVVQLLLSHGANFDHLKFESTDDKFFAYPNAVLDLEATQKLMAVIEILLSKGFILTPAMHLKILKFLIHDVSDVTKCDCRYSYRYDMFRYGSTAHIEHCIKKMYLYSDEEMSPFTHFYYPIVIGEIYIDEKVKEMIKKILDEKNCTIEKERCMKLSEVQEELNVMKSIKITDDLNLHDLMRKHPYDMPYDIAKNFDFSVLKGIKFYNEIIKAHFTKCIVRRYVEKVCGNSMKILCKSLSDACCQMIIDYLTNQDIINVYSVVHSLV